MKPLVIYKWLWLLSERDMSARLVEFSPLKNLLAGSNGTGKSRVVKHLHWALGAEPQKRAAGEFDSNVVAALRLQVGMREYTLVRQNRRRAAFNATGELLLATQSASEWNKFFAQTFDFELQLQRPEEGEFGNAGPSYAALPFYIDQDGGWGTKWTSFWDLGQFIGWQQPLFQSFTGLKPARFVRARLARDQVAFRLKEARVGLRLQDDSFRRVAAMLPNRAATLDESVFAHELRVASEQAQLLTQQQEEARTILLDLAQEREQKHAELQLALRSERDLVEDLAYLAGHKDSETLECPTCGQQHGITFRARLTLADDARDMHELGVKLQRDVETLSGKEVALRKTLSAVATKMSELTASLAVEHAGIPLSDVVAARSKDTLTRVYDESRRDLAAGVDELEADKRALDEELASLTEKSREKRVRGLYKASLISFADKLDVHKSELGSKATIGVRPPCWRRPKIDPHVRVVPISK